MRRTAFCPVALSVILFVLATGCGNIFKSESMPLNADTTPAVPAGLLSDVTDASNTPNGFQSVAVPNEPTEQDTRVPFITMRVGPDGKQTEYYNFCGQPADPAPVFALSGQDENLPAEGKHSIVHVIRTMRTKAVSGASSR